MPCGARCAPSPAHTPAPAPTSAVGRRAAGGGGGHRAAGLVLVHLPQVAQRMGPHGQRGGGSVPPGGGARAHRGHAPAGHAARLPGGERRTLRAPVALRSWGAVHGRRGRARWAAMPARARPRCCCDVWNTTPYATMTPHALAAPTVNTLCPQHRRRWTPTFWGSRRCTRPACRATRPPPAGCWTAAPTTRGSRTTVRRRGACAVLHACACAHAGAPPAPSTCSRASPAGRRRPPLAATQPS